MAVPQSKPFRSEEIFFASDRDSSPESSSSRSGNLDAGTFGQLLCPQPRSPRTSQLDRSDELSFLSCLKALIAAGGHHGLEPVLETITDAAQLLTNASGAALAMWKDGAMVCRARNGETAPPLGAHLNAETGISGECLRTGKMQHCTDAEEDPRVDAEACRSRGLRSIAVLPIQAAGETNGILVAFSTHPAAFTERHIAFLQQLASLAERARAAAPQGASAAAPKFPPGELVSAQPVLANLASDIDEPLAFLQQLASLAERARAAAPKFPPASDRIRDVGLAFLGNCRRALVSDCMSAYASIRYSGQWVRRAVSAPSFGDVALASLGKRWRPFILGAIGLVVVVLLALAIWLGWRGPNETDGKAHAAPPVSAGSAAVNAATADVVAAEASGTHAPDNNPVWKPNPGGESLLPSRGKTSTDKSVKLASQLNHITVSQRLPLKQIGPQARLGSDETASAEPPPLPVGSTTKSEVSELLAKVSLPGLPVRVSQGVSGGQLMHSVPPAYTAQALQARLRGKVVLDAIVMEDGRVGDIKVVEGSPVLARIAVDAVKNWRYEPFQLDGKPVRNETMITINFMLSGPGH
jgi:TonB family protein